MHWEELGTKVGEIQQALVSQEQTNREGELMLKCHVDRSRFAITFPTSFPTHQEKRSDQRDVSLEAAFEVAQPAYVLELIDPTGLGWRAVTAARAAKSTTASVY